MPGEMVAVAVLVLYGTILGRMFQMLFDLRDIVRVGKNVPDIRYIYL